MGTRILLLILHTGKFINIVLKTNSRLQMESELSGGSHQKSFLGEVVIGPPLAASGTSRGIGA